MLRYQLKSQNAVLTTFDAARAEFLRVAAPMYDEFYKAAGRSGRSVVEYVRTLN